MEEKNPLQVSSTRLPVTIERFSNKSGRPTTKDMVNMVKFGPQPKSIIAQMLSERKTRETDDKVEIICQDDEAEDSLEVDKAEEHICSICSQKCNTQEELKKHLNKHTKFTCDFPSCTYSCKLSSNMLKHKRVHTNDKPYLCEKCCFRSNFVNSLKAHKRTHTAERPYQCANCIYKCNSSSNLKKHYRHKHPDTNCQCDKT